MLSVADDKENVKWVRSFRFIAATDLLPELPNTAPTSQFDGSRRVFEGPARSLNLRRLGAKRRGDSENATSGGVAPLDLFANGLCELSGP